jgi:hypothetical protein
MGVRVRSHEKVADLLPGLWPELSSSFSGVVQQVVEQIGRIAEGPTMDFGSNVSIARSCWLNAGIAAATITIIATLDGAATWAQHPSTTLSAAALKEIAEVEVEIDRIEAQALERLTAPPDNEVQQVELLGKAMLYDKQLSVNRNEACAFCHMPETGLQGRCRSSTGQPAPTPVQCARVSVTASRNQTPTLRSRPFCITIPAKAIW